jgi:hypothetical protein
VASAPQVFGNNPQTQPRTNLSRGREWQTAYPTPAQYNDLLPKHKDLCFQRRPRSKQIADETEDEFEETQHPAQRRPILCATPTGSIYDRDRRVLAIDVQPMGWTLRTRSRCFHLNVNLVAVIS